MLHRLKCKQIFPVHCSSDVLCNAGHNRLLDADMLGVSEDILRHLFETTKLPKFAIHIMGPFRTEAFYATLRSIWKSSLVSWMTWQCPAHAQPMYSHEAKPSPLVVDMSQTTGFTKARWTSYA